jgi:hypothetical protein
MNREEHQRVRSLTWILCMTTAVPVLYLLSVPPVLLATAEARFRDGFSPSEWGETYAAPERWLKINTPIGGLMERYYVFWWELTGGSRPGK